MSFRKHFKSLLTSLPFPFYPCQIARGMIAATVLGALSFPALTQSPSQSALVDDICTLIESQAERHDLPADFLARLIWAESRFNPNAVSPKGAEGIAQFMPQTASLRGLADSFDIKQAIPASAAYLAELKRKFGNLGLAAAAYNAGENRIGRWLRSGGFLPLETENYVLQILGEPADKFADRTYTASVQPLSPEETFEKACRNLPVSGTTAPAMASTPTKPWGIQVAGHFRREVAVQQWERVRKRYSELLNAHKPVVSRVRSGRGTKGVYAVRVGADSRDEADRICSRLRGAGGSCIVLRNN